MIPPYDTLYENTPLTALASYRFALQQHLLAKRDYTQYVNPLIGTQKMGHTYPGATVPFGAVQFSPDTDEQPHNIGGKYNPEA